MAGVSRTTASSALSDTGRVSEETRQRVLKVAHELGYRRNAGARALRVGQAPILGILLRNRVAFVPGLVEATFWPRLLFALIEDLTSYGMGVVTVTDVESLKRLPVDAVMTVTSGVEADDVVAAIPDDVPIIVGGASEADPRFSTIAHDHEQIVGEVLDHLTSQGSRRPGLLVQSGIVPFISEPTISGYAKWCENNDVQARVINVNSQADLASELGRALDEGVDAIYSVTGYNAQVHSAITRGCGRRVPEDVLLIGMGEGSLDQDSSPAISNVGLLGAKSGHLVAEIAMRVMLGGEASQEWLPYAISVRASSTRS